MDNRKLTFRYDFREAILEKFRIVKTSLGIPSIQCLENGEIMHNPVGPWEEAHQLYLKPMDLIGRLGADEPDPLVIFDVGLGAATNAVAAMKAWGPSGRDLKVISFEKDLDLLRFTLDNHGEFPFLNGMKQAIESLLEQGHWNSSEGRLTWELRYGEFEENIEKENEIAEFIFFEPYSPKVNPEMWTLSCFKKLFARTRQIGSGGVLGTYSRATSVRSALLHGGFFVGPGVGIGQKEETTLASTNREGLKELLGHRWLERLQKSHIPYPEGTPSTQWPELTNLLMKHPQFSGPKALQT